jgi:hypothetical protein
MKKQLVVRNEIQKLLLEDELLGQMSDGMWENTNPYNHWHDWSEAEIIVGENLGVNFRPVKDNYNLNSSYLLDIIGDRMVTMVNLMTKDYGKEDISDFNEYTWRDLKDIRVHVRADLDAQELVQAVKEDYWVKKQLRAIRIFGTKENLEAAQGGEFTMKDLKNELKDLKKIMKMRSSY